MKDDHLTDEILQAYLLREMHDDTIAEHLATCSHCLEKLDDYRSLISGIQRTVPEPFSFDVTALVMDKIMLYEKKKDRKEKLFFWWFLTFSLVAISLFSIPFIPRILTFFNSIPVIKTLMIAGTGLGVLLFLLADINKRYKKKKEIFFKTNLQPTL